MPLKVLGLDTSGYINALGIVDGERVIGEARYPAATDSLEQIVDNIDTSLKDAGLALEDIDGFGVGLGPGSWTGIRVGVTVGKTLAFSTGKPVAGISSLDALGFVARDYGWFICAVIAVGAGDAVYGGLYRQDDGSIKQEGDYFTGQLADLATKLEGPCVLVAKGARDYAAALKQHTDIEVVGIDARPYGSAVAALAEKRLRTGEQDDALALSPMYLKESTAKAFVNKYAGKKD